MTKKEKIEKAIESYKKQIELHFEKLERDLRTKDFEHARYHIKEIDKSLIEGLVKKMKKLGKIDKELIGSYAKKLRDILEKYGFEYDF